jgi:hypothetical protein
MGEMSASSCAKGAEVIDASGGIVASNNAERGFQHNGENGSDSAWLDSWRLFGAEPYSFEGFMLSPDMNASTGDFAMATWYSPPKAALNSEYAGTKMQDRNSGTQGPFSSQDENLHVAGGSDWVGNLNGSWDSPSGPSYESLGHGERGSDKHINVLSEHANVPLSLGSTTELPGSNHHSAANSSSGLKRRIHCTYSESDITFVAEVKLTTSTNRFISKVNNKMAERLGTSALGPFAILYEGARLSGGGLL